MSHVVVVVVGIGIVAFVFPPIAGALPPRVHVYLELCAGSTGQLGGAHEYHGREGAFLLLGQFLSGIHTHG